MNPSFCSAEKTRAPCCDPVTMGSGIGNAGAERNGVLYIASVRPGGAFCGQDAPSFVANDKLYLIGWNL